MYYRPLDLKVRLVLMYRIKRQFDEAVKIDIQKNKTLIYFQTEYDSLHYNTITSTCTYAYIFREKNHFSKYINMSSHPTDDLQHIFPQGRLIIQLVLSIESKRKHLYVNQIIQSIEINEEFQQRRLIHLPIHFLLI